MKVSITLNGKEYAKDKPSVGDWFDYLRYAAENQGKNLLLEADAANAAIEFVAKYVGAPPEDIIAHGDMEEIAIAQQLVQKAIIEAHNNAAAAVWGKNALAQEPS
jgi:hypothetical protein